MNPSVLALSESKAKRYIHPPWGNTASTSSTNIDSHDNQTERGMKKLRAEDIKFPLDPPPDSHLTHYLSFIKPMLITFMLVAFLCQLGMWNLKPL